MYDITPDRTTTRIITAGPTKHTSPEDANTLYTVLVQVEHRTKYDNNTPYEATLNVYYRLLNTESKRVEDTDKHYLTAHYSRYLVSPNGDIRITGTHGGMAFLELSPRHIRGRRIATYLMNEVVRWAKQWPEAEVYPIELLHGQAINSDEKERRNRFYARFGIEFDFHDPIAQETGISKPMTAQGLKEVSSWEENITEHELAPYLNATYAQLNDLKYQVTFLTADLRRSREELELVRVPKPSPFSLKAAVLGVVIGFGMAMFCVKFAGL
ncbi:N-acetyltransferase [Herbaspirillum rubrisubalbicans Os34]|uniref:N-acetyltransferase n=1 Tax=Herbaspirillum rubrisubalbicans Os34 TaxID=1235827 RepID=A0A6M3ZWV5_9BURK|nr:GNAT family N-acetyltransferase [Herbaspirillum rubrisubalbicans]QJQ03088.1 N-acetyltransferase [Herbaspirillum rubrisubalbicans Os34]